MLTYFRLLLAAAGFFTCFENLMTSTQMQKRMERCIDEVYCYHNKKNSEEKIDSL
jgi:hypothetical protein